MVGVRHSIHRVALRADMPTFVLLGVAIALSSVAGVGIVSLNLGSAERAGKAMLFATSVAVLAALGRRSRMGTRSTGPGVYLAALTLSLAFLLGLVAGRSALGDNASTIAAMFGAAVLAFCVGAAVSVAVFGGRSRRVLPTTADPLRRPLVIVLIVLAFALAAINFLTGVVPLLSENIDASRFSGTGGAFGKFWAWIIGAVEWAVILAGLRIVMVRRFERRSVIVVAVGTTLMIMLAGRSFVVLIGVAILVAVAAFRRLSLPRLVVFGLVGLVLLGAAGKARLERSDTSSVGIEALRPDTPSTVYGLISQSVTIGPAVFGTTLQAIPGRIPFQHGRFVIRDFRAALPLHPLGRPLPADLWVTQAVRGRNVGITGGSPPTLVGGLYIDFGVPGIIIGSLLLGAFLALLYRWAIAAGTAGAFALYCYVAAYIALASYSYISLKPGVLAATALSLLLHRSERRETQHRPRSTP